MVGDDAQRDVLLLALAVVRAGQLGDLMRDVHHGVHIEQRAHVLAHAGQPLEAHACVDVLLLQLGVVVVAVVVKLREDHVPDLDISVAVAADRAAGLAAAVLRTAIIVNFGARAARTGAMLPEVVLFAELEDALLRNADLLVPDAEGLFVGRRRLVARKHGRIEAIRLQADPLRAGQEFPRPGNGLLLEIVAEGEVAQHLKIGAVPGRLADVFDVARADALLTGRHAAAGRLFLALEPRLHRRHAGVDEQDRLVILRHERKTRQPQMTFRLEELQEHFPQLVQTVCFMCHCQNSFNK